MKLFNYLIIGIVILAIVVGFFILGTPKSERLRRLDERRVSDLQSIQWQVINYWQTKNELPEGLSALEDSTTGVRSPVDPETGLIYEYKIIPEKDLTFELCANFKTDTSSSITKDSISRPVMPYEIGSEAWNWQHPIGRFCFERTIDPEQYPPFKDLNAKLKN
jgi:hypothetical protein